MNSELFQNMAPNAKRSFVVPITFAALAHDTHTKTHISLDRIEIAGQGVF